mgnify:CR=1 FL=1
MRDFFAAVAIACETLIGVGLIVPGDTVVLVAGTGVRNLGDFLGLLAFVLLGSFLGESGGFFLGRWFGSRIRKSALGKRLGEERWSSANAFIESRGGIAVALSRFLPVLHSLVPVVSGMSIMPYRVFIRWVMAACSIWATCYLGVGWLLHNSYEMWLGKLKFGGFIFVGLIVVALVGFSLVKRQIENTAQKLIQAAEVDLAIDSAEEVEGLE